MLSGHPPFVAVGYDTEDYIPEDRLITPDDKDPAELEFYRFCAFPHNGGYVGMMLHYCPSPGPANTRHPWTNHGPDLSGEWWVSVDGFCWRRPFRDVFAPGEADDIIRHPPMTVDGRHLWLFGDEVFGLPEDHLFYIGSLANAEFSTPTFTMAGSPLLLNAEFGFHGDPNRGMRGQGYLMAELRGADGAVIEGYGREQCVIHDLGPDAARFGQREAGSRQMQYAVQRQASLGPGAMELLCALQWQGRTGAELADREVCLRLFLRDARVYATGQARL